MTGRQRIVVAALVAGAVLAWVVLLAFAVRACALDTPAQPCPEAGRNVTVVIILAAGGVGLLVTPFAFLAEYALRRRIVYRGAWWRAGRRGLLAAAVLAALAGLRLGGALTPPVAIFALLLALAAERFMMTLDRP
ncbi:MAG: hypothetical protein ACRDGJ_11775 [Candidatus Limnocylindria bacterium]